MTYTENRTAAAKKQILSYADRVTIASVLTWDETGSYVYSPSEIEAIVTEGEMVYVKLSGRRSQPISRYMFRSILEAQRASINKQIESIVEAEEIEVAAAEEEMSRIIHEDAQQEFSLYIENLTSNTHDWLTEPVGSNPDAIFSKFAEPSDEEIAGYPVAANGYHDTQWTTDGCEF